MEISPQVAYENLKLLDRVNPLLSADYREIAQDILADTQVSLDWRDAIADRLNQANHDLTVRSTNDNNDNDENSY
jgi:hypothetical protein